MTASAKRIPWITAAYTAAVQGGAYGMKRLDAAAREALVREHSTNVANFRAGRWHTLATSAFLVEEPMPPGFVALLVAVIGHAERAWGARRTAQIFALGHAGASLLVYAGLLAAGPSQETSQALDVGVSYGFNAVLGARAASLPRPALRTAASGALLALAARPLLRRTRAFTDAGHFAALAIGLGAGAMRFRRE